MKSLLTVTTSITLLKGITMSEQQIQEIKITTPEPHELPMNEIEFINLQIAQLTEMVMLQSEAIQLLLQVHNTGK